MQPGSAGRLRLSAPRPPGFPKPPDHCLQARRSRLPDRSRMLATAFPSPTTAARFSSLHSGVSGPGLLLRFPARRLRRPFRLPLRYRTRFAPGTAASSLPARCRFLGWRDRLRLPPPLPFGTLTSLRIEAFCGICRPPARPSDSPDLPSLPAAVSIASVTGAGSPFQVRYVSAGLLFLKPLGTRVPICSCSQFRSTIFCA